MTEPLNYKALIEKEYMKCLKSPQYFIKTYCYIQHPIRGKILFGLYPYQDEAISDFEQFNFNIILKGRQIGISTAAACYALWLMVFHGDKNVLVIATKQETAKNLITKVKYAFDNLPVWLRLECVEAHKLGLKFANGSAIKASTASEDAGRSEALSLLILDEAAFIKNVDSIWIAALPTLATGGNAILISTPNGVGNFFHQTWEKAIRGEKDEIHADGGVTRNFAFHPIKLDWRVHPERDQAWRDQMGKIQGERAAKQEYDADFIGSGNTVIDAEIIELYAAETTEPEFKEGFDNNLWVWKRPYQGHRYIVVADVARGDGTDYSAFHVIDVDDLEQVAEYKGKVDTTTYADLLKVVAVQYNDALLVVENANHGFAVLQRLVDRSYNNIFYMQQDIRVVDMQRNYSNRYRGREQKAVIGFTTSTKTRPVMIDKLQTYMREIQLNANEAIKINSIRTIQELRVFIWDGNKAQAMGGYNDDLVMSLCIGLWVRDTSMVLHERANGLTRVALDGIKRAGDYDAVYSNVNKPVDPYIMPLGVQTPQGNTNIEDLRWLLS